MNWESILDQFMGALYFATKPQTGLLISVYTLGILTSERRQRTKPRYKHVILILSEETPIWVSGFFPRADRTRLSEIGISQSNDKTWLTITCTKKVVAKLGIQIPTKGSSNSWKYIQIKKIRGNSSTEKRLRQPNSKWRNLVRLLLIWWVFKSTKTNNGGVNE